MHRLAVMLVLPLMLCSRGMAAETLAAVPRWRALAPAIAPGCAGFDALAAAPGGDLLAAGTTLGGNRGLVARFTPGGAVIWVATLGSGSSTMTAASVAVDGTANVFVAGALDGALALTKLDAAGAVLWTVSVPGDTAGEGGRAVRVSPDGIFVGGNVPRTASDSRFFLGRFRAADGVLEWSRTGGKWHDFIYTYTLTGIPRVEHVEVAPDGSLYATYGQPNGPQKLDHWSAAGERASSVELDFGAAGHSAVGVVRFAADGSAYVSDRLGVIIVHLDAGLAAVKRWGGYYGTLHWPMNDFCLLPTGEILMALSNGLTAAAWGDLATTSPDREELLRRWEATDFGGPGTFEPRAMVTDSRGTAFVAGVGDLALVAMALPAGEPKAGRLIILNNVIRVRRGEFARVIGTGTAPYRWARFSLVAPSGRLLADLGPVESNESGWAEVHFDGRVNGRPLSSGLYWIVASDNLRDRKPIVIVNEP